MIKIEPEVFEEKIVTIRIYYELGLIDVNPQIAKIAAGKKSAKSRHVAKPEQRQVRWVVENLREEHDLVIEPKKGNPVKNLFNPQNGGVFRIPGKYNSIVSGRPKIEKEARQRLTARKFLDWTYEIRVMEGEKVVAHVDPCILVDEDG